MTSRNALQSPGIKLATASEPGSVPGLATPAHRRAPRRLRIDGARPRTDPKRLAELKAKLGDADYMNGAILRIATVLSARLTLR